MINHLTSLIYRLTRPPFFFLRGRGGCPAKSQTPTVQPSLLSKFPSWPTLQIRDYNEMIIENSEMMNKIKFNLDNVVYFENGMIGIRDYETSCFVNNYCVIRNELEEKGVKG